MMIQASTDIPHIKDYHCLALLLGYPILSTPHPPILLNKT